MIKPSSLCVTVVGVTVGVLILSGCTRSGNNDYLPEIRTPRTQSNLEVPPDLINTSSEAIKRNAEQTAPAQVLPQISGLEIKRSDDGARWLEVSTDIDSVWSMLVDYTQKSNLPIFNQSKQKATIESDWIGSNPNTSGKIAQFFDGLAGRAAINDKYVFWLERTTENSTAVYVSHTQLKLIIKNRATHDGVPETAWVETSGDGFKTLDMLRNLKTYFGGSDAQEDISGDVVLNSTDNPSIILRDTLDSSQARLRKALVAANYEIVSTNKNNNLLIFRKYPSKEGLFSKFTIRKKQALKIEAYGSDGKTKITVTTARGHAVDNKDSLPVLFQITGQLRK